MKNLFFLPIFFFSFFCGNSQKITHLKIEKVTHYDNESGLEYFLPQSVQDTISVLLNHKAIINKKAKLFLILHDERDTTTLKGYYYGSNTVSSVKTYLKYLKRYTKINNIKIPIGTGEDFKFSAPGFYKTSEDIRFRFIGNRFEKGIIIDDNW